MKLSKLLVLIMLLVFTTCASLALYGCKTKDGTSDDTTESVSESVTDGSESGSASTSEESSASASEEEPFVGLTVSFETFGGTEYYPVVTTEKGMAIALSTPEKAGYKFLGWYLSDNYTGEALGDSFTPTQDATLYAKWEEIVCYVSFVTFGGTEYEPAKTDGTPVILPVPEREGYEFAGWYLSEDYTGKALGESYSATADTTIYAKWTPNFYLLSFETFGGSVYEDVKVAKEGATVTSLPTPIRYSYEFLGWYLSEDYTGEALGESFTLTADMTIYAKWDKVVYVYLYYGESTDYNRLNCHEGDVITVAELEKPAPLIVRDAECPFVKWCYDGLELTDVEETITVGTEEVYLVAVYDKSNIPPLDRTEKNVDGSISTTGTVVKVLDDHGDSEGRFSVDVSVVKTTATSGVGSAEVAFRITHNGADYAVQDKGMYYLMAGVSPGGYIEIHNVYDGTWARIKRFELSGSPDVWKQKYESAVAGEKVTVRMTVCDYGDKFEIYLDNVLLYTCADTALLDKFTGTGFGVRSNTAAGTVFANWQYAGFTTVSFETNGGTALDPVTYGFGALNVGKTTKDGYSFTGWYYDEALTEAVDTSAPEISGEEVTLYAKWRDPDATVILMSEGAVYGSFPYTAGTHADLPTVTPVAANRIFTGWYYDQEFTNKASADGLTLNGKELTLYAGFRYPTSSALTDNGDGTYSLIAKACVAVLGETEYPATRYDMTMTFSKTDKGATGIAFRQEVRADDTYNNSKYIGITLYTSNGLMQVGLCAGNNLVYHLTGIIANGEQRKSTIGLDYLPAAWKAKYNGTATGEEINVTLSVVDYGETFEIYIDGDFAFRYVDVAGTDDDISGYTGVGYGFRHTAQTLDFTISCSPLTAVSFETNGGSTVPSVLYGMGALTVAEPTKENYVFDGWYYDEALTNAVDTSAPEISGEAVTLYAKWKEVEND